MSQTVNAAIAVVGIDIGKNSFHIVGHDERGAIVLRQKWSRGQVEARFANMPPCLIGMEACVGAHHLSRKLRALGHDARLMPAKYVRPYSKGQKNDFRDAEAIAEAVQRPTMKFVATKTADQLDLQALHRVRERLVSQRTGIINQIRAFLLERGIAVRQGQRFLRAELPRILATPPDVLSPRMVRMIEDLAGDWRRLDERVESSSNEIEAIARQDAGCERLMSVPGIGPIISSAMVAAIGAGDVFTKGRDFAAWLMPWLPPLRRAKPAQIDLEHCNGCGRCAEDCPYEAIRMVPRTDGMPFPTEAAVNPSLCVSCGICVGACPSSTPFRRSEDLKTGIDLPDYSLKELRERVLAAAGTLTKPGRVLVLACEYGAGGGRLDGTVVMPCVAMMPPSLIDFALSRDLADGVVVAGCSESACYNRLGIDWTEQRFAGKRDPYLRARVPRDRIATVWAHAIEAGKLQSAIASFAAYIGGLPPTRLRSPLPRSAVSPIAEKREPADLKGDP